MKKPTKAYFIFVYGYDKNCDTIVSNSNYRSVQFFHKKENAFSELNGILEVHEQRGQVERVDYNDLDCSIKRIVTNQGYFFELTELYFSDAIS